MSLSRETIERLYEKTQPQIYRDTATVINFLKDNEPFFGTQWDLARACDMSYSRLAQALFLLRNKSDRGRTVHYGRKGPGPQYWRLVDSSENCPYLEEGIDVKSGYVEKEIRRLVEHQELFISLSDKDVDSDDKLGMKLAQIKLLYLKHALEFFVLLEAA